eukprot:386519_1
MNREVLDAQRRAANDLQRMNRNMNAEQVEDDMEALREAMDEARDASDALTQPLDADVADEDELLAELEEEMGGIAVASPAQRVEALPDMGPAVPVSNLPQKKPVLDDVEEEALRQLEAELNA